MRFLPVDISAAAVHHASYSSDKREADVVADLRDIMLYLEYKSVCALVRIGFAHPLSRKRVLPPPEGGPNLFWQVEGSLALCLLCVADDIFFITIVQIIRS
jgi:hypothetical protein